MSTDFHPTGSREVTGAGELGRTPLDPDAVKGDWISVTTRFGGVSWVRTYADGESFMVGAHGADGPRPGDWGEVKADGVFAMRSGGGFTFSATFDSDVMSTTLQTNQGHGVMALNAFHRFTDGSGRPDYFTREFYVLAPSGAGPATGADRLFGSLPTEYDPSGLTGPWRVLDPETACISALECTLSGDEFTVRARGIGEPADWGSASARLYADSANPERVGAFLATFDLPDRRVFLQARDYLGLLVTFQYVQFADGGKRADFSTRDVFYR